MITTHPNATPAATTGTRTRTVLVAEDSDATRALLSENVPRHIFGVLCPGRLCARSGRPVMSGSAPSR
jgi:hypothetical protein